jgi:uncharacterized cupredoxin-like copper-binding protein
MRIPISASKRLLAGVVTLMLMGSLLAACGGGDDEGTVHVTLTDSATTQSVESDVTTFTAGEPYHFVVENKGQLAHELMIVQPIEAGTMDMEQMDEMALYVIEKDDLEPGTTYEFDFVFPSDSVGTDLEFACHLAGHYEAGMHLPITVKA